ncbi:response regulator [Pontiellaceae bacterium B1224]|nr:response regulator [Pontiellaceae bacterium B1224]
MYIPDSNMQQAPDSTPPVPRKYRLLFVDDMRTILMSLERLLRKHQNEWDMAFANSGSQALEMLEKESFDIIISDVVMPEMNGVELLEIIKQRYPTMIRFILSGHADHQTLIRSVGTTHQFMAKPCDRNILTEAISRALALRNLFHNNDLLDLVKDSNSIPTLPELYQELTSELASNHGSAEKIGEIISKDITVSAKVLQLVNSAFFGLSRNIESIGQAVSLLGAETINSIVLTTTIFNKFEDALVSSFDIQKIYGHSITVGATAYQLVKQAGLGKHDAEEALLAGMMHDLGVLALIDSGSEIWKKLYIDCQNSKAPLHVLEREQLGITHAEVGAYLLGVWGLPNRVIEAVAFHHTPGLAPTQEFCPLAAVYLANHAGRKHSSTAGYNPELDARFLSNLKMDDLINDCLRDQ